MKPDPARQFQFRWLQLGFAGAVCVGAALLAGCKGNTTAAAVPEHPAAVPPKIEALQASPEIRLADPFTSSVWKPAQWREFAPPINSSRTTPPTRGAVMFDEQNLYLAVISRSQSEPAKDGTDQVCFYLDTTAKGKELLEFRVDAGKPVCAWLRSDAAARPLDDGTPDFGFPVRITQNIEVKGLWVQTYEGNDAEGAATAMVMGIPLASLPGPVRFAPSANTSWKLNMIRTITLPRGEGHSQQLESDLSPIYSGAQAVSPYRMAELRFAAQ